MSATMIKLSEKCRFMNICGVNIVGCPDTGMIIGLDSTGEVLVQRLKEGIPFKTESFDKDQLLLLNTLLENGFCTDQSMHGLDSTYLHVTSHCNLNCEGCYSYETSRNQRGDLTLAEMKKVLDNLAKAGLTNLVISGGEPFLRTDILDIFRYAKVNLQISSVQCISNGTASIESYLESSKYLDVLSFSLDSPDSDTAIIRPSKVFDTVVEKITMLKKHGVNTSIVFTIHHRNVNRCIELCNFANQLGVAFRFSILTVKEFGEQKPALSLTDEDYAVLQDFLASNLSNCSIDDSSLGDEIGCALTCGAGKTIISIASDGLIYPCHMFNGIKEFTLGSALHDDIYDIVSCNRNNSFLSLTVDDIEQCQNCHIRYVCGGGCRFRSYALHNSIYYPDKLCKTYIACKEGCIMRLMNP